MGRCSGMGALGSLWVFFTLITPGVLGELGRGVRIGAGKTSVPRQKLETKPGMRGPAGYLPVPDSFGDSLRLCLMQNSLTSSGNWTTTIEVCTTHGCFGMTAALVRWFSLSSQAPSLLRIQQVLKQFHQGSQAVFRITEHMCLLAYRNPLQPWRAPDSFVKE